MKRLILTLATAFAAAAGLAATHTVKDGETLVVTQDMNNDGTVVNAYGGSTVVLGFNTNATYLASYAKVVALGGEVTISNAYGKVWNDYWMVNGLRTKVDGGVDGSVRIVGARRVMIGRQSVPSGDISYPPCEVNALTFDEPDGQGFYLRDKSTLRKIPAGHKLEIADGATVALQGAGSLLGLLSDSPDTLTLDRYDVVSCTTASLPDGCKVNVPPGRTFTFRSAGNSAWTWGTASGSTGYYRVNLGGKGAKVVCRGQGGYHLMAEAEVSGEGEIAIQSEKDDFTAIYRNVSYVVDAPERPVVLAVSDANVPAPTESWKGKVAYWFDADKADTIVKLTYDCTTHAGWEDVKNEYDGHPIVVGWTDAVKGTDDVFLYTTRIFDQGGPFTDPNGYVLQTCPYLVEGGLNGKSYICCGDLNKTKADVKYGTDGKLASAAEVRRLRLWKGGVSGDSKPSGSYTSALLPYCIMVYGSQQGGGKAMLGTVEGYGNLARADSQVSLAWTAYDGFSLVADGRNTMPKNNHPSGGWQIVSLDMSATNTYVNAIGRHQADSQSGGQNYAEVIFFRERPTPAERYACELYLAEKWGLTEQYRPRGASVATLTGRSQAKVELWNCDFPTFNDNDEITVDGDFAGTVTIPEGRTLVVADKPAPPTEADVPSENRLSWFDPSFAGALSLYDYDTCRGGVRYLYNRTLDAVSQSWTMCANDYESTGKPYNGRYPFVVEESRGGVAAAPVMPWMDFSKQGTGDTLSNTLRSHTTPAVGGSSTMMNIRQGFMVLDTSKGGGSPIGDTVGFSKNIKYRDHGGAVAADPIWAAGNTAAAAMEGTWLDTTAVDGTTHGFNGCGEVLSFTTKNTLGVAFMGYYNVGKGNEKEVMGESIFYTAPLSDADRLTVQEYLMYKWFGDLRGKYSDLSKATVAGAGTVRVSSLDRLPILADGFTGAVQFAGPVVFTVGETKAVSCALDLSKAGTVTVNVPASVDAGAYLLVSAPGGVTGLDGVTLVLSDTAPGYFRYRLAATEEGLALVVKPTGLGIFIR